MRRLLLCAAACPADCIYIEAAENTEKARISGGERYAEVYNIDYSRCIFCGYCVEACPTDAITHGHGFEIASFNTSTLIYRKEQLLAPLPRRHRVSLGADEEVRRQRRPLSSGSAVLLTAAVFGFDRLQVLRCLTLNCAVDRDALLREADRVVNLDSLSGFRHPIIHVSEVVIGSGEHVGVADVRQRRHASACPPRRTFPVY